MSKKVVLLAALVVPAALVIIFGIGMIFGYNNLVDLDVNVDNKYYMIEIRLQERHDLIPNIVASVEGLQEHEEAIYDAITSAREAYASADASGDMEGLIEADALEAVSLMNLLAVIEDNYPNIAVTSAYQQLMDDVEAAEGALAVARWDYNNAVTDYNASVRRFPRILYASMLGFEKEMPFWRMNEGADEVPVINFSD
ncbi:MAG: LemA family protein [Candidatus Izemoplasmatales bacterium]|nr:LemA family protein [Candidatus Izemoplasmatales bacterium]